MQRKFFLKKRLIIIQLCRRGTEWTLSDLVSHFLLKEPLLSISLTFGHMHIESLYRWQTLSYGKILSKHQIPMGNPLITLCTHLQKSKILKKQNPEHMQFSTFCLFGNPQSVLFHNKITIYYIYIMCVCKI